MIKNISIENFKSIKEAKLDCSRVNVFIGEPNSGKTNILEAIGLLSLVYTNSIESIVRFEDLKNLFYDNNVNQNVELFYEVKKLTSEALEALYGPNIEVPFEESFKDTSIKIYLIKNIIILEYVRIDSEKPTYFYFENNKWRNKIGPAKKSPVKYYEFKKYKRYEGDELNFIYPPHGKNLFNILHTNPELRNFASDLFKNYDYYLQLDPSSKKINLSRFQENVLISQPYYTVADTLQRMLFYTAIIDTNKDSTIVIDEPDVYLFPKYTKYLAERIAKYNSNQFFLTTHNPYFLLTLAEKTPEKDLKIFLTFYENFQTKVKSLNTDEILNLREEESSLFFNLDKYKD